MSNPFFDRPVLNSPYECPRRHWELDPDGQPTQQILETRRRAEFITPIPKPKKRKKSAQQNDPTSIINQVLEKNETVMGHLGNALPRCHSSDRVGTRHELAKPAKHKEKDSQKAQTTHTERKWELPGVNHLGTHGRWAFAEFTEAFQIQADFKATIDVNFNQLIERMTA